MFHYVQNGLECGFGFAKGDFMSSRKKKVEKTEAAEALRSENAPVTQAMLYLVRDELKSHIISHDSRFDSIDKKFESIDKKFESIDSRFDQVDKRFDAMDKRFDSFEAKIESIMLKVAADIQKMQAEIHRGNLLAEEQNARNKYVIDQHELLKYRFEKVEERMDQQENDFKQLIKKRKPDPMP